MPLSTTSEKRTVVRGLGEIALRVNNLDLMQKFYAEVIGLPLMNLSRLRTAMEATLKCSPYSTAPTALVIAGRTQRLYH